MRGNLSLSDSAEFDNSGFILATTSCHVLYVLGHVCFRPSIGLAAVELWSLQCACSRSPWWASRRNACRSRKLVADALKFHLNPWTAASEPFSLIAREAGFAAVHYDYGRTALAAHIASGRASAKSGNRKPAAVAAVAPRHRPEGEVLVALRA